MLTISNQKVAGFEPRWADFRGYSLLFDNPGNSLTSSGALLVLNNQTDTDPELGFYWALNNSVAAIGREMLIRSYLFCPLPPSSYHVTVWDGSNAATVADIVPAYRPELEAQLKGLPSSLARENLLTDTVLKSSLACHDVEIVFHFDRLLKWGNSVLVAALKPSDGTRLQFQRLTQLREGLSLEFLERYALKGSLRYSPHVSLGYFANQEAAQQAAPCIEEWSAKVREQIGEQSLTFYSLSLYGFTDMAHFFKISAGG